MSALDMESERQGFEASMRVNFPLFPLASNVHSDGSIEYLSAGTQHMWRGWLAAKRAAQPAVAAIDYDALVELMCLTMRHDFGLDRAPKAGPISSGTTPSEREALRRKMRQLVENCIKPAIAAHFSGQGGEDARDAARYRWLVSQAKRTGRDGGYWGYYVLPTIDGWDYTRVQDSFNHKTPSDAIDAAIAAKENKP